MNRIVIFDLETTGFYYKKGDRIIEFAGVEIIDRKITGKNLVVRINPEGRKSDEKAFKVHGITDESLVNERKFKQVLPEIVDFIRDAEVIAHNAYGFDEKFFNYEIEQAEYPESLWDIVDKVSDSLTLSKSINASLRKHNLDALCDFYKIDRSKRVVHGALIDCELLAEVYLKMTEGVDLSVSLQDDIPRSEIKFLNLRNPPKKIELSAEEIKANQEYLLEWEKEIKRPPLETVLSETKKTPRLKI